MVHNSSTDLSFPGGGFTSFAETTAQKPQSSERKMSFDQLSGDYQVSCSDCSAWTTKELLEKANDEDRKHWVTWQLRNSLISIGIP